MATIDESDMKQLIDDGEITDGHQSDFMPIEALDDEHHDNDIENAENDENDEIETKIQETTMWEEEFEYDEDNLRDVHEIDDKDITEMIRVQKKYEKYGSVCSCCGDNKILGYIDKNRALFICIAIFVFGFSMSYVLKGAGHESLGDRARFYAILFAIMVLCVGMTKVIVYCIMTTLVLITHNSWSVFYTKGLRGRLFTFIVCAFWRIALYGYGHLIHYDYNTIVSNAVSCIWVSAFAFLLSHMALRYVALNSYFTTFKQQTRKLKTFILFLEIMLNKSADSEDGQKGSTLFSIPFMNFLVDFPNFEQIVRSRKHEKNVSFTLERESKVTMLRIAEAVSTKEFAQRAQSAQKDINLLEYDNPERKLKTPTIREDADIDIIKKQLSAESADVSMDLNAISMDLSPDEVARALSDADNEDDDDIDEIGEIYNLNYNLYKVNITEKTHEMIGDSDLNKLSRILSYLLFIRLNEQKSRIINKKKTKPLYSFRGSAKTKTKPNPLDLAASPPSDNEQQTNSKRGSISHDSMSNFTATFRGGGRRASKKVKPTKEALIAKYGRGKEITRECVLKIFKNYGQNKELLTKLGTFAWKKFAGNEGRLTVNKMNQHIFKIMKDLLLLKQSIDSYAGIIGNLERIINNITPLLLLFAYLYIFNFDFTATLGLYITILGPIGFFGSSYFGTVFSSISFIVALNPFLVGDWVFFDEHVFQVHQISLMACVMKETQNGYFYMYQNKQLADSKKPIVNLSRSINTKYRLDIHVKGALDVEKLNIYLEEVKKRLRGMREARHAAINDLKVEARDFHGSRKKVNFTMPFITYSPTIRSLVLNTISEVLYELGYNWTPGLNVGFKPTPLSIQYEGGMAVVP